MTINLCFREVIPLLAKNRQVIAIEPQAYGHTADIDPPFSFEALADDVSALFECAAKIIRTPYLAFMLQYKDATARDLPLIVDIYNSTVPGRMVTADTELISVESRKKWFDDHDATRRPLWMVSNEEKDIVGWVSFQSFYGRPAYDGTVEISIYLAPGHRGRGYGKQILQYAIDQSPRFAVKTLLGFIFAHNEPSLKLFDQMGFKEWASMPNIASLDGVERTLKILGRRVG